MSIKLSLSRADYACRLRREHELGRSVFALAKASCISCGLVKQLIKEAGGEVRGRSAANRLRMQHEGINGRKRLVEAANKSRRGSKAPVQELLNKAATKSRLRGFGEAEVKKALLDANIPAEAQMPCGTRNLDIGVGNTIAVELVTQGNFRPQVSSFRDRIEYLRNRGRCVICVTFRHNRKDALIGNLEDVIAFVKRAYGSPSIRRKHWVIFCRSERFIRTRNDLGQLAAVRTTERFFNVVRELYSR